MNLSYSGKTLRLLLMMACCVASIVLAGEKIARPNVVFILCDDLGYGDVGCYGQTKIRTPNLDRLAAEGMKFTRFYSGSPVCAPSRCVLLTGKHPGHSFIRDNREIQPEGQFPIPAGTATLPKLLKQLGYATGAFGKWGLGGPGTEGDPLRQGFDRFYGYNCQRAAHNYYPRFLWDNNQRVTLRNSGFSAHQKLPSTNDPSSEASYSRYKDADYAPDLIMEQARRFLVEHKSEPFFLYVPTPVPHLALQVPEDSLAEYRGKWPDPPYPGNRGYLPHFTPRAAYAAMITRFDREVGRLMDLVKELGLEESTLFVFTSDNGPLYDQLGGTDADYFQSAGAFRGRKGSLYEGGFRVPAIVRWKGQIKPGTTSDRMNGFEDWLPTLLELAGASVPSDTDGISFAATLRGGIQPGRSYLYREFADYGGQQWLCQGDWVGVRQNLNPPDKSKKPNLHLELYNLRLDPEQKRDVCDQNPTLAETMNRLMRQAHVPSKEFPFPALDDQ